MEKKYVLRTDISKQRIGHTLFRIQAVKDFSDVKAGDLGGWIEKEENLSHEGLCWVYDDAQVFGNARVYDNAWVYGDAHVFGNALAFDNAQVYDNAWVYGDALVFGNALVRGSAKINRNASISSTNYYLVVGPIGSRNDFTTFYKTESGDIWVSCGCFNDSIAEFERRVKNVHGESVYGQKYLGIIPYISTILN